MSDEATPAQEAPAAPEPPTIEARLAALEAAVASLGSIHVSQKHDGLAGFVAWLEKRL